MHWRARAGDGEDYVIVPRVYSFGATLGRTAHHVEDENNAGSVNTLAHVEKSLLEVQRERRPVVSSLASCAVNSGMVAPG